LRELLERFDSRELTRWWNYWQIEPWGWKQDNRHFGTLASLLAPKLAQDLCGPENWFTDELPERVLYEDDDDEELGDA
jgi:hypothetical protein